MEVIYMDKSFCTSAKNSGEEEAAVTSPASTLGIRTVIAILIFAAFVCCDRENLTFHNVSTKEVFSQIEWNPLPIDEFLNAKELSFFVHIT